MQMRNPSIETSEEGSRKQGDQSTFAKASPGMKLADKPPLQSDAEPSSAISRDPAQTATIDGKILGLASKAVSHLGVASGIPSSGGGNASIYERMRRECEEIEQNHDKGRELVFSRRDLAFLMQRNDEEITKLQIQQAKELKEKADMFDKSTKARAERKAAKKLHRSNMRRIKYRDMLIQKQETIERATQLLRQSVLDQSEAFETLMSHVRSVHEQQRIELMAAQERKLEYERAINDLEINSKPDEIRLGLAKKFQVRQSHQRILNKRLNEHLRDRQIVEARHVKEKFELESRCADEMGTLRVSHVTRIAEQQESQFLELNNEKEQLQAEHETRKLAALAQRHQAELRKLRHIQKIALKQMKLQHEQRVANYRDNTKNGIAAVSQLTASTTSIPPSATISRGDSVSSMDDVQSDAGSVSVPSPLRIAARINSMGPKMRSGQALSYQGDEDDSMSARTPESQNMRASGLHALRARQQNERTSLIAVLQAETNDVNLAHSAQLSEFADQHRLELEKLEMEQREEIEQMRTMQEKEILVEQSVHESEMAALVERRVLNSVLESVVDGIINIQPDGVVTRFNRAAERIFGYSAKEVVGNNIKMLMPENYATNHDRYLMSYMNTGIKKVVGGSRRLEGKRKNGEIFPMQLSVSEVKEHDQHLFTGVARDMTKKVQLENEIREKEELEQRELQKLIGELDVTKAKTEDLLSQMLPRSVANQLMDGKQVTPQTFDNATVFFLDVVGFTTMCASMHPTETVSLLDAIYNTFDEVIQKYDAYKVETIGDSYLIVSGIPTPNGDRHASEIATLALEIMSKVHLFQFERNPSLKLRVRIGLNTGPVVAGVVGTKMPRYCLFGDTVNTGSRMESTSQPMRIQISESTCAMLKAAGGFQIVDRGEIDVKASCGKGKMRTYFLNGKENFPFELPSQ